MGMHFTDRVIRGRDASIHAMRPARAGLPNHAQQPTSRHDQRNRVTEAPRVQIPAEPDSRQHQGFRTSAHPIPLRLRARARLRFREFRAVLRVRRRTPLDRTAVRIEPLNQRVEGRPLIEVLDVVTVRGSLVLTCPAGGPSA